MTALLGRVCATLGESFGLGHVDAYRYLPEERSVVLVSADDIVSRFDEHRGLERALAAGTAIWADGSVLVPLYVADGCLGFLAASSPEPLPGRLDLLNVAGAFVATLLQRALEHEELERLSRLQSQFIALASHELRAPAAVVHGVAKTVVELAGAVPTEQLAALHEALVGHTERMTRLLDELLDLSRLEAKAIEIQREPTHVRERVEEIVRTVAGDRAAEVAVEVDPELQPLLDAKAFDRIIGNLVTNALRYGRTPITVKAVQNDRHFRLAVEDHGDGVSPGFVPHLFERFSRDGRDGGVSGSGLGLSIAQAYAQAHGGQLSYEDARPHGARFQLVLPAR